MGEIPMLTGQSGKQYIPCIAAYSRMIKSGRGLRNVQQRDEEEEYQEAERERE